MLRRPARVAIAAGALLIFLLLLARAMAVFYTDALWFANLGYLSTFWTRVQAVIGVRAVATLVGGAVVLLNLWVVTRHLGPVHVRRRYGNLEIAERIPRTYVLGGILLTALLAGLWLSGLHFGGSAPLEVLAWARRSRWGVSDPLFERDLTFYVFSLPLYIRLINFLLLSLFWAGLLSIFGYLIVGAVRWRPGRVEIDESVRLHLVAIAAAMVLLFGIRYGLGRYLLPLDGNGFGGMMGYTDVHARLPAYRILAVLSVVAAGALLLGAWRRAWAAPLAALITLVVAAAVVGRLYPSLVQKFQVEPNELDREAPYIRWNLDFTRQAFDLQQIRRVPYPYRGTSPRWERVGSVLARLPLWDPAPLDTAYKQKQSLFAYYRFPSVDFDRYGPPGQQEQVAISAREFAREGLPPAARTWQTLHLNPKYLRGMGAVVSPVARSTSQGEPYLWVSNVNPVQLAADAPAELGLPEPSVFIGERMGEDPRYIVVVPGRDGEFTGVPGRDFPQGVQLNSLPRLLAAALRFGDKNLLFSGEIDDESRIIFRRSVAERIRTLAPFLLWDADPYPVIEGGRLQWVIDGYTATVGFPFARPVRIQGIGQLRYMRNSVKAVIDAVSGEVAIFAVDEADPILRTYRRLFPELVRPGEQMPEEIRRHLRYPALMLRIQAEVLETYHLEQPEAFYAGQDVWELPQERALSGLVRGYQPLYLMSRVPGEQQLEFVLVVPFIARERQNMTALLLARNDPPNYGELLLYELPRDQQIPGPVQVRTLIEQDPIISPQFSLWRQAGSDVDLGRIRVLPLDSSFLYVAPLFLSSESNPIPQLARVIVSDGRNSAMAPGMAGAVTALRAEEDGADTARTVADAGETRIVGESWASRAYQLLQEAEQRLRSADWVGFGARWQELRELLEGASR